MPKEHFTSPSYSQISLKSLMESFLKEEDINLMGRLEKEFNKHKQLHQFRTPQDKQDMAEIEKMLEEKWNAGEANHKEKVLLGMLSEYIGAGTVAAINQAKKYYQSGVDAGYAPALYQLGQCEWPHAVQILPFSCHRSYVHHCNEIYLPLMRRAGNSNYAPALFAIVEQRRHFKDVTESELDKYLTQACELNYAPALTYSFIHSKNIAHGIRASELGDLEASRKVIDYMLEKEKYEEAIKHCEIAIEQGDSNAYHTLALLRSNIEKIRDLSEAAKLFRMGALLGETKIVTHDFEQFLKENPDNPTIIYHAGMAGIASEKFNRLAKDKMDDFVVLSMDDKWEDIYERLDPSLRECVFQEREKKLKNEIHVQLQALGYPMRAILEIGNFWSKPGASPEEMKVEKQSEQKEQSFTSSYEDVCGRGDPRDKYGRGQDLRGRYTYR